MIRRANMNMRRVCELADFDDGDVQLMERAARACLENRREIPGWLGRFLDIGGFGDPIAAPTFGVGYDAERQDLAGLTEDPSLMAADVN